MFIGLVNSYFAGNVLNWPPARRPAASAASAASSNGFNLHEDLGATWTVTGSDSIGTLTDDGALTVAGSLDVSASLDPASTGTIALGATATLEVASVLGKGPAIAFLTNDTLSVDTATDFGLHVGKTTYIGPLLEHFVAGDAIDLENVADSGLVTELRDRERAAHDQQDRRRRAGQPAVPEFQPRRRHLAHRTR